MLLTLQPTQNADSKTLHMGKGQTKVRRATATMNFPSNQKNSSIRHWPVMENRSKPARFHNEEDYQAVESQSMYQFISQSATKTKS